MSTAAAAATIADDNDDDDNNEWQLTQSVDMINTNCALFMPFTEN